MAKETYEMDKSYSVSDLNTYRTWMLYKYGNKNKTQW